MATGTAPRDWWEESDEVIATALAVLAANAERIKRKG